jgi:Flp pilus assembly protein CpaB
VKKKSPPYAIIGAVVLGVVAMILFVQHEKAAKAAADAALAKAQADAAAALQAAQNAAKPAAPTVNETPTNMRKVLYATQPIAPGVRLSPSFFEVKLTPAEILPDAYTDGQDIVGWYATRNIEKGDPLTPRNIGKTLPFMEGRIAPGMRAVALPIFGGEANYTGGFVVDGDKVDLLMSRLTEDTTKIYDTQMVMQNLQVLYVPGPTIKTDETNGLNPVQGPAGAITVMFEVTPEQAQALVNLAQVKQVRFSMILKSRRDNAEVKIKPFVAIDYFDNPKRLQKTTDASIQRVQDLQKQIDAEEAKNQGQGNTNATSTIPPAP